MCSEALLRTGARQVRGSGCRGHAHEGPGALPLPSAALCSSPAPTAQTPKVAGGSGACGGSAGHGEGAARGPRPETAAPQSPQSPQSLGFAWLRPAGRPRRPWTASTRRKGSLLGEGYGRPGRPAWREVRCFASLLRSQTSIQELKALGKPPRECVDVVAACGFLLRQAWDRRKASSTFGLTAWKGASKEREREKHGRRKEREREIHVRNPPPAQIHPNSGSGRWATFDAKTSPGSQICKAGTAKTSPGSNFPKIPKPFSPHRCQDFVKFEPGHVLTASDAKASPGSNFPQIPKISATMARHSP